MKPPPGTGATASPVTVVTGGTGFIGTHLVERLLADGANVRLLARRPAPVIERHRDTLEVIWGDIRDAAAVSAALAGAHTVFHLAGLAKSWARRESEFTKVNTVGTANVCRAARAAGVSRVVHMSTSLLIPPGPSDWTSPLLERTAYQQSKRAAEQAIRQFVRQGGDAVIVRPSRVFGPGTMSQSNTVTRLIDVFSRGRFRLRIADGDARANYVFVRDVVEGLLLARDRGECGEAYALGGEDCSLREFLDTISRAGCPRYRVFSIPVTAARVIATVCEAATHLGISPFITRPWTDIIIADWPVSSEEARKAIGWAPRPLEQGVRETLEWLRAGKPTPVSDTSSQRRSA